MALFAAFSYCTNGAEEVREKMGNVMRSIRYERGLANTVGISAIFVLGWLAVRTRVSSPILALILAFCWTVFAGGQSLYYWRRDDFLKSTNPMRALGFFAGTTGGLAIWFLASCEFAGVNALHSRQWSKLWVFCPRSTFLLAVTSAGFLSMAVATFLRIGTLRLLRLLTSPSGESGQPGTGKPVR